MDAELHRAMLDALLRLPGIDDPDTRTNLLAGIDARIRAHIRRNLSNARNDISNIIRDLEDMTLENGQIALSIVIDNAQESVKGLQLARELLQLREKWLASRNQVSAHSSSSPYVSSSQRNPSLEISALVTPSRTRKPSQKLSSSFEQGYALVIGVSAYPNLSALPQSVLNDAIDVYTVLCNPQYAGYVDTHAQLLLNEMASANGIRAGLHWLANVAEEDSTVIIYFSGHGGRVEVEAKPYHYLIPVDCDPNDLYRTAISSTEFTQLLQNIHTKQLLVLLDCCYAGGVGALKMMRNEQGVFKRPESPGDYQQLAQGNGRVIIASSRSTDVSHVLGGMNNSIFTHYLLEALRGQGRTRGDGFIRFTDVFDYVSEKVPLRHPQHPVLLAYEAENFSLALDAGGVLKVEGYGIEEKGLPLFECIHKDPRSGCQLWDQHPPSSTAYGQVTSETPCRFCGHKNTLKRVL